MKRIAKLITALAVVLTVSLGVNLEQATSYSGTGSVIVFNPSDGGYSSCWYYLQYFNSTDGSAAAIASKQSCSYWTPAYAQVLVQYDQWPWAVVSQWYNVDPYWIITVGGPVAPATGACVRLQWAYNTAPSNWSCISYWS